MKERGCASPEHSPQCPCPYCRKSEESCNKCPELTIQHIVPQSIGRKVLHLSEKVINSYAVMESKPCHRVNDYHVTQVFESMMKQKRNGIVFNVNDVLRMRKEGVFRK